MSKAAETILKEGIALYNSRVSNLKKFALSEYEYAMFAGFMEEYACLQIEADRERVIKVAKSNVQVLDRRNVETAIRNLPIILD